METPLVTMTLAEGIIYYIYKPGAAETLADAEQAEAKLRETFGSAPLLILVDISELKSVTREARAYHASKERNYVAGALVTTNPVAKVIGNFFLGLNKPFYPTRLFTSREEAAAWLKTFL